MNVIKTEIPDVLIFEPKVFGDERGFFFESFNQRIFEEAVGRKVEFVQDNHSKSSKGVLRGLHYQLEPYAQGKLVRCVVGEVFDVAVDIRKGFAHGFLVLSDLAEVLYKTNQYYAPSHEKNIIWNDLLLNIKWPSTALITLSDKDANGERFELSEF